MEQEFAIWRKLTPNAVDGVRRGAQPRNAIRDAGVVAVLVKQFAVIRERFQAGEKK